MKIGLRERAQIERERDVYINMYVMNIGRENKTEKSFTAVSDLICSISEFEKVNGTSK